MKGLFIPEITAEMFRNGCLESIEALMAEGEIYDIEYPLEQDCVGATQNCVENALGALDCISRQAVLEQINCWIGSGEYRHTNATDYLNKRIKDLQTVNPQEPKKGQWIWCVGSHKCSNCEEYTCFSHKEMLRYCPNCGADMRGET